MADQPVHPLQLRHWRRQVAGVDFVLEANCLVAPVAEGLVGGMAAAAETNPGATSKAERLPFRIDDLQIAFHSQGPVVGRGDFCCGHSCPPKKPVKQQFSDVPVPHTDGHARTQAAKWWAEGRYNNNPFHSLSPLGPFFNKLLVLRDGWVNLVGPRQDAASQVEDFPETRLAQEIHCFGGALPAAAMRHDFLRGI